MKVEKWVTCKEAEGMPDSGVGGMGGFFNFKFDSGRWKDYVEGYTKKGCEYLEALRFDILEKGIRNGGLWHQSNDHEGCPVFSDGTTALFTMRAWGDLMAAIYSEKENHGYCYTEFAWKY